MYQLFGGSIASHFNVGVSEAWQMVCFEMYAHIGALEPDGQRPAGESGNLVRGLSATGACAWQNDHT